MTQVATLVYACGIVWLFFLDRDRTTRTSPALWLPTIWFLIVGSRPVSSWLGVSPGKSESQYLEGSPVDRNSFFILLIIGLVILIARHDRLLKLARNNTTIIVFLSYCLVSVIWSDYSDVAFKRWLKYVGDHVMVLVILTDRYPSRALKQVLARGAFVLLPLSVLFIKYYPALGRVYASHWTGRVFYTGVATDKNMLGMVCMVYGIAASWRLTQEFAGKRRRGVLAAHGIAAFIAVWLLTLCDSKTSVSLFVLGSALITATTFWKFTQKRAAIHFLMAALLIGCAAPLFFGVGGGILTSMGRNSTLTGRTDLWDNVLRLAANPILGAGFESYWLGERLEKLWAIYWWRPNESHNGYIEVYLNLGWLGITLLLFMIAAGYRNILKLFAVDPEGARLRLAYFFAGLAYSFTEAGIHTVCSIWMMFMLSIIALPERYFARSPSVQRRLSKERTAQIEETARESWDRSKECPVI